MTRRGVTFSFLESILRAPPPKFLNALHPGKGEGVEQEVGSKEGGKSSDRFVSSWSDQTLPQSQAGDPQVMNVPTELQAGIEESGREAAALRPSQQHPGLRG